MIFPPKQTAILFPGQGVKVHDISEYYQFLLKKDSELTLQYMDLLSSSLKEVNPESEFNAEEVLKDENSEKWRLTSFIQPLTFTLCMITFKLLENKFPDINKSQYALGHSLGAVTALTASGALPVEEGVRLISARGKYMQEDSDRMNKGMCAVVGLTTEKADELCRLTGSVIALINAPSAFVVCASRENFPKINEEALRLGAAKTIILDTSGPFHTPDMKTSYEKFKNYFAGFTLKKPEIEVVANMKGSAVTDPVELKNDVIESIINPVNWMRMIDYLKDNAIHNYIEIGPGTSLSILCRINGVNREEILHAKDLLEE